MDNEHHACTTGSTISMMSDQHYPDLFSRNPPWFFLKMHEAIKNRPSPHSLEWQQFVMYAMQCNKQIPQKCRVDWMKSAWDTIRCSVSFSILDFWKACISFKSYSINTKHCHYMNLDMTIQNIYSFLDWQIVRKIRHMQSIRFETWEFICQLPCLPLYL